MTPTDLDLSRRSRYSTVAIILHWAIAALIIYNLLRPIMPRGFSVFHVSAGITILVLSLARVIWRLLHRPPALVPMSAIESRLAHLAHVLLYVLMLGLPLSGWALVSASPPAGSPGAAWAAEHRPTPSPPADGAKAPQPSDPGAGMKKRPPRGPIMVWGLFRLPLVGAIQDIGREPEGVPRQRELHEQFATLHQLAAWVMFGLLILHVAGALKHQFIDHEREFARMGLG